MRLKINLNKCIFRVCSFLYALKQWLACLDLNIFMLYEQNMVFLNACIVYNKGNQPLITGLVKVEALMGPSFVQFDRIKVKTNLY